MVLKFPISILTKQHGRKNHTNEFNDRCANGVKIAIFACFIFHLFLSFEVFNLLLLLLLFISIVLQLVGCNLFMYVGWI
jgi:hypothetical protein